MEQLYDLDSFSDKNIQEWQSYGRAVRDYHYALFFDLEGQRAARHKDIRAALQRVPGIDVCINDWVRIVNFKYSLSALSPLGSLEWVGQRFNFGHEIDEARFPPFPALYIAQDFETAFREYHGLSQSETVKGLGAHELLLENAGSFVTLKLVGNVVNIFDLTSLPNLNAVCKIFAKFTLSNRVRDLERKAKRHPPTKLVRTPRNLLQSIMRDDWKAWPVHFDVPSNSQVFATMIIEAGFEGILYPSAKGRGKCLAIFTRQLTHSSTQVSLHPDKPDGIQMAEINASNCQEV